LRALTPDRPGELAPLLANHADSGATVLAGEHQRTGRRLHLDEVEVLLQLETRGQEHSDEVVTHLQSASYVVTPG
jgi:threonine dehydratase